MLKLNTPVLIEESNIGISYSDKILVIGSCFADNIGKRLSETGFDVLVNPFGTLYNPMSIFRSMMRLSECRHFTPEDCVEMGSGAGLVCSFSHHTSFARRTAGDFLENANSCLETASAFYRKCNKVIITFGTSWCYRSVRTGEIVSNCLKIDAREFTRERMGVDEITALYGPVVSDPGRKFIFTVSPIRHLKDGAHGNQVSKSTLLLAVEQLCSENISCEYFPAYEIMLDELRDYRFYAEDMIHPSAQAIGYIWERFTEYALNIRDKGILAEKERDLKRSSHIEKFPR